MRMIRMVTTAMLACPRVSSRRDQGAVARDAAARPTATYGIPHGPQKPNAGPIGGLGAAANADVVFINMPMLYSSTGPLADRVNPGAPPQDGGDE